VVSGVPCRSPVDDSVTPQNQSLSPATASLPLVADDVAWDVVQAFAMGLTAVPVRTIALGRLTPDGRLAAILGAAPGEPWIIRPDGHIAAVVPAADRTALAGAIGRVLALPAPVKAS
jgi:3-(3-hydroxy-phenyl)propionate hydroxylase